MNDELLERIRRILDGIDAEQVFVFGPEAVPFIAKRKRVTHDELHLLRMALESIEQLETTHQRPFTEKEPHGRFLVMALDEVEDLYLVALLHSGASAAVQTRISDTRKEFRELMGPMRRQLVARA